ncbi:MAG TPA: hypothetical protein DCR14_17090 [Acidimicrobiaceae bacterium]|nr:hypothetical protein [Acidimicrobiaceae bacterium]
MSEEMVDVVLSHAGQTRRAFIAKLVLGSAAFAAPVVASFTIGGSAAPRRSPIQPADQEPILIDCGPNSTDEACNTIDEGPNTVDEGPNTVDEGPNTVDDGCNTTEGEPCDDDSGSGVPGGGGIPATE